MIMEESIYGILLEKIKASDLYVLVMCFCTIIGITAISVCIIAMSVQMMTMGW